MNDEAFTIPKWAWAALAVVILLVTGFIASPHDQAGHPILLLPDAKEVEDYRHSVSSWHERMRTLDAEMNTLLSGKFGGDLLARSRKAQLALETTIQLAQEIDQRSIPTAAIPAKEMALKAASAYLDSARAILQWVSAPKTENLRAAQQSLKHARQALAELEKSEWIQHP